MNKKAKALQDYLDEKELKFFKREDVENEVHTSVFRATMEVKGQELPAMLVTDDSIFTMLQVRVAAAAVNDKNKERINAYFNEVNRQYKVFKFCAADNGDITIESCIPAADDNFDPKVVHAIIDLTVRHLEDTYPTIMKKIWDEE